MEVVEEVPAAEVESTPIVSSTTSSAIVDNKVVNPFEIWIDKMQNFWNVDVLSLLHGADDDDETKPIPPGFPTLFVYSGKANNKIGVRERPALDAPRTGKVIEPGERFAVDRILKIKGVQFAVLSSVSTPLSYSLHNHFFQQSPQASPHHSNK
jgi:hypothetical protein